MFGFNSSLPLIVLSYNIPYITTTLIIEAGARRDFDLIGNLTNRQPLGNVYVCTVVCVCTSFHLIYECRKSKATLISIILLATPPRETPEMMTSVNFLVEMVDTSKNFL